MIREEAINFLNGYLDEEVYTEKCRNAHKMAIKALEQESIIDKIRAEIAELDNKVCQQFLIEDVDKEVHHAYQDCLDIIDKYRAESEE